jgi:hypothetical protein
MTISLEKIQKFLKSFQNTFEGNYKYFLLPFSCNFSSLHGKFLTNGTLLDYNCSCNSSNFTITCFFNWSTFRFLPFKFKDIPLIISGTPVMKLINEVPLNWTGTVFGITGNLLIFTRNEKSLNLTEIMIEITINHFNIIRNGETFD